MTDQPTNRLQELLDGLQQPSVDHPLTAEQWASRAIEAEAKLTLANAEIERLTRYHDSAQAALAAGAEKRDELEANAKAEAAINSELNRQLDCALRDIESRKVTEDMLRGRLAEAQAEIAAVDRALDAMQSLSIFGVPSKQWAVPVVDRQRGDIAVVHTDDHDGTSADRRRAWVAALESAAAAEQKLNAGRSPYPCTRIESHAGPCNGYPRNDCLAARET
jgi:hypothetical protein